MLHFSADTGYVNLSISSKSEETIKYNTCCELTCEGSASPHRKIMWYRLLNDSALPITSYWSEHHYYKVITTLKEDQGVSSSLVIHKFGEGYKGNYCCELTNDDVRVSSPVTNLLGKVAVQLIVAWIHVGIKPSRYMRYQCSYYFTVIFSSL